MLSSDAIEVYTAPINTGEFETLRWQEIKNKIAYAKLSLKPGRADNIYKNLPLPHQNNVDGYVETFTHNMHNINLAFYGDDDRVIEAADILKDHRDKIIGLYQRKGTLHAFVTDYLRDEEDNIINEVSVYSGDNWNIHYYFYKPVVKNMWTAN